MSMRRQLVIPTAAATLSLLIVTCGPPGVDSMRDAMVEGDGGSGLVDALMPDAAAHEPVEMIAACDVVNRQSIDYGDGRYSRTTYWFAEVDVPGVLSSSVQDVTTILSDYETFGTIADPVCPAGATCMFDPGPWSARTAQITHPFMVGTRLRVFCGSRTEAQYQVPPAEPMPTDSGERARSVRFVVQR